MILKAVMSKGTHTLINSVAIRTATVVCINPPKRMCSTGTSDTKKTTHTSRYHINGDIRQSITHVGIMNVNERNERVSSESFMALDAIQTAPPNGDEHLHGTWDNQI